MKIAKILTVWIFTVALGLWSLLRFVMDWVGRSTFGDDWAGLVNTMPEWFAWLYGTPWWVPGALAATSVAAMIYWLFRVPPPALVNPSESGSYYIDRKGIAKLASLLSKIDFGDLSLNVLYNPTYPESADLSDRLGDAVKSVGTSCSVHQGAMFDHDPKDKGLFVLFGSKHADVAHSVVIALAEVGFLAIKRENSQHPSAAPCIYVAGPPRP